LSEEGASDSEGPVLETIESVGGGGRREGADGRDVLDIAGHQTHGTHSYSSGSDIECPASGDGAIRIIECALVFGYEAKIEIEAKISFGFEAKKWVCFRLLRIKVQKKTS
jgi:hypothetical protein